MPYRPLDLIPMPAGSDWPNFRRIQEWARQFSASNSTLTIAGSAIAGGGGGITAITAGTTSATGPAVVFSNVNNVSFGVNGNTVTASASLAAGAGDGLNRISAGSQLAGTLATVVFSNSYNVSFGMSNSSIVTASASYSQSTQPGIQSISAGTTRATTGEVIFSSANNVVFGMNNGTVTASASYSQSTAPAAISAGTTSATNGTVVFANSNNVSFGMDSSTITASASYSQSTAPAAISAGTTSATNGTVVFANSNGLTFGMNASTITASYTVPAGGVQLSAGVSTEGNTAGSTGIIAANRIHFVGTNLITLSQSTTGSSIVITIDASVIDAVRNVSFFDNHNWGATNSGGAGGLVFTNSHRSLFVAPINKHHDVFPGNLTARTAFLNLSLSGSTATMSQPFTSHFYLGIYTANADSLSLLNSASASFGFAAASTNNSLSFAGQRFLSIHSSQWSASPTFTYGGTYYMAWFWSSSSRLNQTGSLLGHYIYSSLQRQGTVGISTATATSMGWNPFYGVYTATTNALPANIAKGQLNKVNANAAFVPHLILMDHTASSAF